MGGCPAWSRPPRAAGDSSRRTGRLQPLQRQPQIVSTSVLQINVFLLHCLSKFFIYMYIYIYIHICIYIYIYIIHSTRYGYSCSGCSLYQNFLIVTRFAKQNNVVPPPGGPLGTRTHKETFIAYSYR